MTIPKATATPQRLAKAGDLVEPANVDIDGHENFETIRLLDGSPLAVMARRKQITGEQYAAGARLYTHWYYGGLPARSTVELKQQVDGGGPTYESDRQLYHRQRYHEAVKALGLAHGAVVCGIVIDERSLSDFESRYYRDKQARVIEVLTIFRTGLDALDHLFNGHKRATSARTWAADGAKPGYMTAEQRAELQRAEDAADRRRRKAWARKRKTG